MKKIELKPISIEEFEKHYGKTTKESDADKIVEQFVALATPVAEVIDYPNKTADACVAALRKSISAKEIKDVKVSFRKGHIFLFKDAPDAAEE